MKKVLCLMTAVMLLMFTAAGCGKSAGDNDDAGSTAAAQSTAESKFTVTNHAEIVIKEYGTLKVELYGEEAPKTVANFVKLAKSGFYDGLTFHRIYSGFVIQGGDPEGTGMGGSKDTVKGEFSLNGVKNNIKHERGVLSMARSSSYDSASSQFFIVHQDANSLDGSYAGFGKVTEGMEIVDEICKKVTNVDSNGTVLNNSDKPIIETIKITD